jgi:nickel-dependent lactate racemase
MMAKPLKELLQKRPDGKICVVISDATRPVPSGIIVNALISVFDELNIPDSDIQILIGTGLHRKTSPEEIVHILGSAILERFDVINHNASDDSTLEYLGETSYGTPIYVDKTYLNASFKIITGYVEPHFFAGFSGGRKAIVPGIAGSLTIQGNHSAKNMASEYSRFGILENNPIYEDALEVAKLSQVKPDFMVNVCINPQHEITKIIAGSLQAYKELVKYQEKLCFFNISEPYDVVIAGNGGYPLDQNLYQAVKSMAIGELGVKPGGTIISVNECSDGVGHEKFQEMLNSGLTPQEMFEKIVSGEIQTPDQWEIQVLCRVLMKAEIYVVSTLSQEDLGIIGLKYAATVNEALDACREKYGDNMRVLVLPDGPLNLPKSQ